jgi:hypothetical protein
VMLPTNAIALINRPPPMIQASTSMTTGLAT